MKEEEFDSLFVVLKLVLAKLMHLGHESSVVKNNARKARVRRVREKVILFFTWNVWGAPVRVLWRLKGWAIFTDLRKARLETTYVTTHSTLYFLLRT